jgi:retron-type reverse transcriptase
MSTIKTKIYDQAFIDLLYKYIKVEYKENIKLATLMKTGVIQGGTLSTILANIYMHPFDEWVENFLKPNFDKKDKREKNLEYFKNYYKSGLKVKDKSVQSIVSMILISKEYTIFDMLMILLLE